MLPAIAGLIRYLRLVLVERVDVSDRPSPAASRPTLPAGHFAELVGDRDQ